MSQDLARSALLPPNPEPSAGLDSARLHGILCVDKPEGLSSHDVVARARRWTGVRRIGHAGTLDPFARGLLLLCLGDATRVVEYLIESDKEYVATLAFGGSSDTDDRTGSIRPVAGEAHLDQLSGDTIRQALGGFVGRRRQVPPAFSAIKIAGQPAYKRARRGAAPELAARDVVIRSLDLVSWHPGEHEATIAIHCSKGTYVRALARDLGEALGTGAYLTALARTASGSFRLSDAVPLDRLRRACARGTWGSLLHPLDAALTTWPAFVISPEGAKALRSGTYWRGARAASGELARAYEATSGELFALIRYDATEKGWQPFKVMTGTLA